ncbi:hypothetical protein PG996_006875 [Apiospora saccharicola]|uniref:Uncharacterized protein n=1 Tax=Apiospora saccharicola TaxID=335842 RepID=A0ABR1V9C0_9PEZI
MSSQQNPSILNTGFLYLCGHRDVVYGQSNNLYDALMNQGLVPDWPDMDRELETCCAACWSHTSAPVPFGMRTEVLRQEHLDETHAHSLLALLYHLSTRLQTDPDPSLVTLLATWAQCVATRYITNATHEERFRSAIWTVIPPLVAEDAVGSIKTHRAPIDWPGIQNTAVERFALAAAFERLRSRDHSLRRAALLSSSRWPAELTGYLFDLNDAAIRYAALFKTEQLDLREFGQAFRPLLDKGPQDYSLYVYHSKLVDAVRALKLAIYQLALFASGDGSAVKSREELKEVMTMATLLKGSCDNVHDLHVAFLDHLAIWKAL